MAKPVTSTKLVRALGPDGSGAIPQLSRGCQLRDSMYGKDVLGSMVMAVRPAANSWTSELPDGGMDAQPCLMRPAYHPSALTLCLLLIAGEVSELFRTRPPKPPRKGNQ